MKAERFEHLMKKMKECKPILVLGDVGIDKYTYGEVKRISPEAPVPVLEVTKEWRKLGLAANISHNLKTLGLNSTLCGVIGNDLNANLFETLLEDEELKTWGLWRSDERPTIVKERVTTNTQQICRIDYESLGPISTLEEKRILKRVEEFTAAHGALIIEDYAKGLLTEKVVRESMELFKAEKKWVAVDPSRGASLLLYKGASLFKPNWQEAQLLAEQQGYKSLFREKNFTEDLKAVAEILMTKGDFNLLVITLGSKGMALLDRSNGHLSLLPTVATEVFDVSGAGDTAISVLTASLMAGATLQESAFLANGAAGVVVGKKGTATVNVEELRQFCERFNLFH